MKEPFRQFPYMFRGTFLWNCDSANNNINLHWMSTWYQGHLCKLVVIVLTSQVRKSRPGRSVACFWAQSRSLDPPGCPCPPHAAAGLPARLPSPPPSAPQASAPAVGKKHGQARPEWRPSARRAWLGIHAARHAGPVETASFWPRGRT